MRLSEEKIKQAILNPDLEIRERAVRYFSACHSDDEEVTTLVIQSIERYGREDAYHLIGGSVDLNHTEETISWIVDELNDPDSDRYENYTFNLTRVLCNADPALLIHRDTEILESRHFFRSLQENFTRRLELLSWDEAECWRRLEEICEEGKDKQYANEVDISFAEDLLEAMARMGGAFEDRVLSVLSQKIDDFENNPMKWLEPLMVKLAGLLRLESAVPLILGKLHENDDLLAGSCVEALSRIATDRVVAAVAEGCAKAERHFRLYATGVFENIHSDLAVEKALGLMAGERDQHIRQELAHAALSHFADEAIEPVRQLLRSTRIHGELRHLRDYLVVTCTIMEERFPEYEEWRAAGEREREEHRRQLEAVADDPNAALLWTLERAKDYFPSDVPDEKETAVSDAYSADELLLASGSKPATERVGRNDPCPCGSGKKYKKCCLKKEQQRPETFSSKFPIGTVALYGPDDKRTTKIVASVISREGAEPVLKRWVGSSVKDNPKVRRQIQKFFDEHGVKSVVATDRNMGCPHEEGEDFPVGEDCPFCPWWKGKQGSGS